MKQRRHRLIVRDALRVGAFHDSAQLFGQADFAFLHHFVVADNVQFYIGSHHGDTVYLFVAEELVGNLDDAFRAQLLALEVEADSDIVAHVFQSEQGDYGKQSLGGYMVYYSAVFQSSNLQFLFLFA